MSQVATYEILRDVRAAAMWVVGLDKWPEGYSPNLGEYNIKNDIRTAAMWATIDATISLDR